MSVQVNALKDGKYPVYAKFVVRGYYRDSTLVNDRDQRFLLSKESGSWMVEADTGTYTPTRHDEVSAPASPEETDVPAAAGAQPDRGKQAAANGRGGAVPLGQYNCVMSAGGQLIHVGGFTLQSGGVYHDEDNGRGTFTYDSNLHQIAFQGAAMGGQMGRYAGGTFTLKSARNSVDCDQGN